jgi:hypothetical protein
MGGSGGGAYFQSKPEAILKKLRESEGKTRDEEYEAKVASYLGGLLGNFNDRDSSGIQRHLDEIRAALGKDLAGSVDLKFGGSVSKRTYVEGLSDVDALVMLDNCTLADGSPGEALKYFCDRLRERFPKTAISEGQLAVTVRFADAEIQLLPAVSCRGAVKIADPRGEGWSRIKPQEFAGILSDVNEKAGYKVVPVVKLAKAIVAMLPAQHRISGYHAESLGVAIFRNYEGPLRPKDMLRRFFTEASTRVLTPMADTTGQSVHVDDYLGSGESVKRRVVSDAFGRIARRMHNADVASAVDSWKNLFDD